LVKLRDGAQMAGIIPEQGKSFVCIALTCSGKTQTKLIPPKLTSCRPGRITMRSAVSGGGEMSRSLCWCVLQLSEVCFVALAATFAPFRVDGPAQGTQNPPIASFGGAGYSRD